MSKLTSRKNLTKSLKVCLTCEKAMFSLEDKLPDLAIVTLTTDYRLEDPYVAMLKARLLVACPDAHLLDISHGVDLCDIAQAVLVVGMAVNEMPAGTVHLVCVGETDGSEAVAFLWREQIFICVDNGFPSILTQQDGADVIVKIPGSLSPPTFPALGLADVVGKISGLADLAGLGEVVDEFGVQKRIGEPIMRPERIQGAIQYVDSHGNLITNIPKEGFDRVRAGRRFEIRAGIERVSRIHLHYGEKDFGDCLALFNASGWLEIAIYAGNASQLLGMKVGSPVMISFEPGAESSILA